ncbi:MAG: imidazole glycerol phosphate synthase subunit HisF [Chloroflexi bacterium]|nr:imidazole glycerol phosphate synthase subunit HisF [Chloroflexota bacterium]
MLTKRIIPCLDVTGGRVVKGISFVQLRDAGDPAELAAFYDKEGADELVFLDITASSDNRNIMVDVVSRVAAQVFIPLTVGGGLRTLDDMRHILESGADKVGVNSAAIKNPGLITDGARKFGSQCVVVAIDAKRVGKTAAVSPGPLGLDDRTRWEVYINGGRTPMGIDALKWAVRAAELGAGEILLTSMDADGHLTGYDLELTRAVCEAVNIPVIASGGAGKLEHLYDGIVAGKADAVLAASIFHYGTYSIRQAKEYLAARGIPVRL